MGRRRPNAAGGDDMAGNRHMVSGMVVGGARGHGRGSVLLGVAQMSPTGTRTSAFVRTRGTTHPTTSQDGVIFPADTSIQSSGTGTGRFSGISNPSPSASRSRSLPAAVPQGHVAASQVRKAGDKVTSRQMWRWKYSPGCDLVASDVIKKLCGNSTSSTARGRSGLRSTSSRPRSSRSVKRRWRSSSSRSSEGFLKPRSPKTLGDGRQGECRRSGGGPGFQPCRDLPVLKNKKRGSFKDAMEVMDDAKNLELAVADLRKGFSSNSSRAAKASRRKEVLAMAKKFCGSRPIFPLQENTVVSVAAALSTSRFRSVMMYVAELKQLHGL